MPKFLKSPEFWISSVLAALILSATTIYFLINAFSSGSQFITYLYQDSSNKYEYELRVPDYWQKVTIEDYELSFNGKNYEYAYFNFKDKPKGYEFNIYGSQMMTKLKDKYAGVDIDIKPQTTTYNGQKIYYAPYNDGTYKILYGFVENNDFLTEFMYKTDTKTKVNNDIKSIITNTKRFKVQEAVSSASTQK